MADESPDRARPAPPDEGPVAVAGVVARLSPGARWGLLAALGVATALACALVGLWRWPIGLRDEWTWPYYRHPSPWAAAQPAVLLGVLLIGLIMAALRRPPARLWQEVAVLALCLILAFGVILTMSDAGPGGPWEGILVNAMPWIGGYWGEATRVENLPAYLRGYHAHIARFEVNDIIFGHISDHPPGPVVFHWFVNRVMEHPAAQSVFPPPDAFELVRTMQRQLSRTTPATLAGLPAAAFLFLAGYALALLPIYLVARELLSREAALIALGLAAFIPSAHLFGPYPDQFFMLFAAWSFYAGVMAMRRRSALWAAVSAAVLFIGFLWTLAHLMVVALIGLTGLLALWSEAMAQRGLPDLRPWIKITLAWLGVFLAGVLFLHYGLDCRIVEIWRVCLAKHATFAHIFPRSRWGWTLFNPLEFALFIGVPLFLLAALAAALDARRWWPNRRAAAPAMLLWGVPLVIAALNLSGKNLGETARLWLMLMPLAAPAAAVVLDPLDRRRGAFVAAVLALMLLQLTVFRLHLNVFTL